ncbi:TPA: hypothetical protein ACVAAY_008163, partial [Burkholderia contaminans]
SVRHTRRRRGGDAGGGGGAAVWSVMSGSFFDAATAGAQAAPTGHERRALSKGWRETGTFFSQSLAG